MEYVRLGALVMPPVVSRECALPVIPDWKPYSGRCGACAEPITAKRRKWCCSKECTDRYLQNHMWSYGNGCHHHQASGYLLAFTYQFALCAWRDGCDALYLPYEVNHIKPRRGEGYIRHWHPPLVFHKRGGSLRVGHNLEVLCHPHHVAVTKAQRVEAR